MLEIKQTGGRINKRPFLKRLILRSDLKDITDAAGLRSSDREFQGRGALTVKARSPLVMNRDAALWLIGEQQFRDITGS